ncbi:MAG: hypothetical protein D6B28_05185 [Gammaproteobacteria bacterium]|nr:MAG: hypothetical protein D6B28_05185 [Gammaproteobacteria bacterium]
MAALRQFFFCLLVSFGFGICGNVLAEDEDWGIEENNNAEETQVNKDESQGVEGDSQGSGGNSFFNKLMEAAGSALGEKVEEELDRATGTYAGKITDIILIERLGNKLVLDARYQGIKRSDGVSVVKEVMYQGGILSGFRSSPTPVSSRDGKVRLAIRLGGDSEDDGWGIEGEDTSGNVYSDQIRLSLVRDKKPDKQFGTLVFDLEKLWSDSEEPDQPFAENEEIELADDSNQEGKIKPMPGTFVKPGVVLKPAPIKKIPATISSKASQQTTTQKVPAKPVKVRTKRIMGTITVDKRYDIYANASRMLWSTGRGQIEKIGADANAGGYIKKIAKAKLTSGNNASKLIYAHPAPGRNGFAQGILKNVKLDKNIRFKSAVGFVGNNNKSDGSVFTVYLIDSNNKRIGRKFRKRVNANKYDYIDFDLSRYKGKTVSIVMHVDGGANSAYDSSVWIAPRLEVAK